MFPDHQTRLNALDCAKSILVQAPAGSGKTSLLAQRYLSLLARVNNPEEIVALTFTRKAVAEMRSRIVDALLKAENQYRPQNDYERFNLELAQQVLARNQRLNWGLIANPNRLQVQTFDSLSLSIVNRMPLLAKTRGLDEPEADNDFLFENAAVNTLNHLGEDDDYSDALKHVLTGLYHNRESMKKMIIAVLKKRDQWMRVAIGGEEHERKLIEDGWNRLVTGTVDNFIKLAGAERMTRIKFFYDFICANLSRTKNEQDFAILKEMACVVFTGNNTLRKQLNKNQGFPPQDKATKAEFSRFLDEISGDSKLLDLWLEIKRLPAPEYSAQNWLLINAVLKIIKLSLAYLELEFNSAGKVDFTQIAQSALTALGCDERISELGLYFDYAISHILVDEFQDTSHSQFALLEQLTAGWEETDGRTLFLVGDPMQSIYRFREADVGLFLRARQRGIGQKKPEFLRLESNFRSSPQIVNRVNEIFPAIFPSEDDMIRGAVSYSPSKAVQKTKGGWSFHGFVSDDDYAECMKVGAIVRQTLQERGPDHSIAILLRNHKHISGIARALEQNDIAYQALDMISLTQTQTCEDLKNLTFAFTHLADRAAWLAVLRAPWCGMLLADLQKLSDFSAENTLWKALQTDDALNLLSSDGEKRAKYIRAVFNRAFTQLGSFELKEVIVKLWHELGGENIGPKEAAAVFFANLPAAIKPWGLDRTALEETMQKLYAPPMDKSQVVCMTIHKAKGLEFDTVILPLLGRSKRPPYPQMLLWSESLVGAHDSPLLLLAPLQLNDGADKMHDYLKWLEKLGEDYEERRLFYVGATRAKRFLHITATLKKPLNPEKPPVPPYRLKFIYDRVQDMFVDADSAVDESVNGNFILRRKSKALKTAKLTETLGGNIRFAFKPVQTPEIFAGILFHKLVELISATSNRDPQDIDKFVTAGLGLENFSSDEKKIIRDKVLRAVNNIFADKTGKWILNTHTESKQEWKIAASSKGEINYSVIDRSFVDEGVRWIVDYKLAEPDLDEPVDMFLIRMEQKYKPQMEGYGKLAASLDDCVINKLPVRLMLYFPLLPGYRIIDSNF